MVITLTISDLASSCFCGCVQWSFVAFESQITSTTRHFVALSALVSTFYYMCPRSVHPRIHLKIVSAKAIIQVSLIILSIPSTGSQPPYVVFDLFHTRNTLVCKPPLECETRPLARNRCPYRSRSQGIGISRMERHAKIVPLQWTARLSYICNVNSGKTAPSVNLRVPFAASAFQISASETQNSPGLDTNPTLHLRIDKRPQCSLWSRTKHSHVRIIHEL